MKTLSEYIIESTTGIDGELVIGQNVSIRDFKKQRKSFHQGHMIFDWKCPALLASKVVDTLRFEYMYDDGRHSLMLQFVKGKESIDWIDISLDEHGVHGVIDFIRKISSNEKSFTDFMSNVKDAMKKKEDKYYTLKELE